MINMNIRFIMFEKNIHKPISELSEEIGIPRKTLTSYINNSFKMINREHLDKLVDYFDCSVSELITFEKQLDMDLAYEDDTIEYYKKIDNIKSVHNKKKMEREKKMIKELLAESEQEEVCGSLFDGCKTKSTQAIFDFYIGSIIEKKIKDEFDELVSKLGFENVD